VTTFNGTTLIAGGGTGAVVTETLVSNALANRGIEVTYDTGTLVNNDAFRLTYAFTDAGGAYNAAVPSTFTSDTYVVTLENTRTGARQSIDITQELFDKIGSYDPTANIAAGDGLDVAFSALGVNVRLNNTFDKDANIALTTAVTPTNGTNQTLGAGTVEFATNTFDKQAIDALQALGATVFNQATGALTLTVDSSAANNLTLVATAGLRFQVNNGTINADNAASANFTTTGGATAILSIYLTNGGGTGVQTKLIDLNLATTSSSGASGATDGSYVVTLPPTTFGATYASGANTKSFGFKVGTGTSTDDSITVSVGAATAGVLGIGSSTIDTAANADSAITSINTAINTISSRRADIGASQSRLEFASNSINVAIENATAATSALLDVDVSSEITKFTSKQVLLQAGVSLLAQANQQPALLLRLLQ
jgi:flagellin-like hook-associated protein FlgL